MTPTCDMFAKGPTCQLSSNCPSPTVGIFVMVATVSLLGFLILNTSKSTDSASGAVLPYNALGWVHGDAFSFVSKCTFDLSGYEPEFNSTFNYCTGYRNDFDSNVIPCKEQTNKTCNSNLLLDLHQNRRFTLGAPHKLAGMVV